MVISKEQARVIAEKLCEKKKAEFLKAKGIVSKIVTDLRKKQIPADVLRFFKKHPGFFQKSHEIRFEGHGLRFTYMMMTESLPYEGNLILHLTSETANKIKDAMNNEENARVNYVELREEIINALLSLRTHKRISESFPEAAKHLPKPVTYLPPAIPIETIMKKIKGK